LKIIIQNDNNINMPEASASLAQRLNEFSIKLTLGLEAKSLQVGLGLSFWGVLLPQNMQTITQDQRRLGVCKEKLTAARREGLRAESPLVAAGYNLLAYQQVAEVELLTSKMGRKMEYDLSKQDLALYYTGAAWIVAEGYAWGDVLGYPPKGKHLAIECYRTALQVAETQNNEASRSMVRKQGFLASMASHALTAKASKDARLQLEALVTFPPGETHKEPVAQTVIGNFTKLRNNVYDRITNPHSSNFNLLAGIVLKYLQGEHDLCHQALFLAGIDNIDKIKKAYRKATNYQEAGVAVEFYTTLKEALRDLARFTVTPQLLPTLDDVKTVSGAAIPDTTEANLVNEIQIAAAKRPTTKSARYDFDSEGLKRLSLPGSITPRSAVLKLISNTRSQAELEYILPSGNVCVIKVSLNTKQQMLEWNLLEPADSLEMKAARVYVLSALKVLCDQAATGIPFQVISDSQSEERPTYISPSMWTSRRSATGGSARGSNHAQGASDQVREHRQPRMTWKVIDLPPQEELPALYAELGIAPSLGERMVEEVRRYNSSGDGRVFIKDKRLDARLRIKVGKKHRVLIKEVLGRDGQTHYEIDRLGDRKNVYQ